MAVLDRPRPIAFSVINNEGRVDARRLADAMDITITQLAAILGTKPKSLSESPTSRKIQEAATKIVEMMDDLANFLQERRLAVYWLRTTRVELGDQSPLDWLMKGKLEEIRDEVTRTVRLQPE